MSKLNKVVGIDVSLTNTAMYFGTGSYEEVKGGKERAATRLRTMYDKILAHLKKYKPKVAVMLLGPVPVSIDSGRSAAW